MNRWRWRFICQIKSIWMNGVILRSPSRFVYESPEFRFRLKKDRTSVIEGCGRILLRSHLFGDEIASLTMGRGSRMIVNGDFVIGNGVRISIDDNGVLEVGGKLHEPTSGITSNSSIMVRKKIRIGSDFICAWDTYITDCEWHGIEGSEGQADVNIGNHVWVAHGSSVLKGAVVGDGCVVGCRSVVLRGTYPPHSLVAGNPAKPIKTDIHWHYEL